LTANAKYKVFISYHVKMTEIKTDNLDLSEININCKTEEEIWKSETTKRILENIIQNTPFEKKQTHEAIIDLVAGGVFLKKNEGHVKWLIEALSKDENL